MAFLNILSVTQKFTFCTLSNIIFFKLYHPKRMYGDFFFLFTSLLYARTFDQQTFKATALHFISPQCERTSPTLFTLCLFAYFL